MRIGQEMRYVAGAFNLLTTAEHTLIGSTTSIDREANRLQRMLMDPHLDPEERRQVRKRAMVPIQLLPYTSEIPKELYKETSKKRRNTYSEGLLTTFAAAQTDNGERIVPRFWYPPLAKEHTGQVKNFYVICAVREDLFRRGILLPAHELDKLAIRQQFDFLFTLSPRRDNDKFRILRVKMGSSLSSQ